MTTGSEMESHGTQGDRFYIIKTYSKNKSIYIIKLSVYLLGINNYYFFIIFKQLDPNSLTN